MRGGADPAKVRDAKAAEVGWMTGLGDKRRTWLIAHFSELAAGRDYGKSLQAVAHRVFARRTEY